MLVIYSVFMTVTIWAFECRRNHTKMSCIGVISMQISPADVRVVYQRAGVNGYRIAWQGLMARAGSDRPIVALVCSGAREVVW